MKVKIHPPYRQTTITCACGAVIHTRSTRENMKVELCSACHPFFTGRQKIVDTAGRVERFRQRYKKTEGKTIRRKPRGVKRTRVIKKKKKSSKS